MLLMLSRNLNKKMPELKEQEIFGFPVLTYASIFLRKNDIIVYIKQRICGNEKEP